MVGLSARDARQAKSGTEYSFSQITALSREFDSAWEQSRQVYVTGLNQIFMAGLHRSQNHVVE